MNWAYFLLIGWWLGAIWFCIGLLLTISVIFWPAGVAMLYQTPKLMFGD